MLSPLGQPIEYVRIYGQPDGMKAVSSVPLRARQALDTIAAGKLSESVHGMTKTSTLRIFFDGQSQPHLENITRNGLVHTTHTGNHGTVIFPLGTVSREFPVCPN